MAYSKQTWATGDTITAEKLNHMEDGIDGAGGGSGGIFLVTITPTGETSATSDKSSSEIITAIGQGMLPFAVIRMDGEIVGAYPFRSIRVVQGGGMYAIFGDIKTTASGVDSTGECVDTEVSITGTTVTMNIIGNYFARIGS